ncbi:MAG TPA: ComEC/Rec2 family competence protein, partial [Burkholderiaceae bacterium]|nr:ComEC/Rec2 family competence protein [Burkholderiaceae bacterium]
MGRHAWIFAAGTGWMAGSALQTLQPHLAWPAWRWVAGLAGLIAVGLAAGLAGRGRGRGRAFVALLLLLLALAGGTAIGWALTEARAAGRLAEALAPELEGEDLQVVGVITGMPVRRAEGIRFPFEIEAAWRRGRALAVPGELPARVSLGWYREAEEGGGAAWPVDELPRAGQRWRFTLRLRRPHGSLNPNGFDYELWMFEQGLRATGYVRSSPALREADQPLRLGNAGFAPMRAIEQARQAWRDALWRAVGDRPAAGVLAALAVGDQAAIERSDWEVFRLTGVAHLVAISGLHVTLWAWLCGRGIGWLWRRSRRAMHALPAPRAAQWGGLLAALVYALLAGWGVPAQRTVVMLATATLLRSGGWRWPGPLVLWATAWVVLAFDPWALWQAGFWLSFVAVALLMSS